MTEEAAAPEAAPVSKAKYQPSEFLKSVLGRPVVVKLNSGVDYRGILACLDGYMNIAMEQTEEYVNGQLKAKYGDCFIRGNNGNLTAIYFALFFYFFLGAHNIFSRQFCTYQPRDGAAEKDHMGAL